MKALLNFVVFIFCIHFFSCKKDTKTFVEEMHFKAYNFPADDAISIGNNAFIVVDYIGSRIIKIDANGNTLWEKRNLFKSWIRNLAQEGENNIIVKQFGDSILTIWEVVTDSSYNLSPATKYQHLEFTKLDLSGNIILKRRLNFNYNSTIYYTDAIQLGNGNFIFGGLQNGSTDYSLHCHSASGDSLFSASIIGSSLKVTGRLVSDKTNPNGYFILKDNLTNISSAQGSKIYIYHGDNLGNTSIVDIIYNSQFQVYCKHICAIITTPSHELNLFFNYSPSTNQNKQYLGFKANDLFEEIIQIKSITTGLTNEDAGGVLIENNNTEILLGSEVQGSKKLFRMLKINNTDLRVTFEKTYDDLVNFKGLAGVINLDGSITVVGSNSEYNSRNHTFLLRINPDGSFTK